MGRPTLKVHFQCCFRNVESVMLQPRKTSFACPKSGFHQHVPGSKIIRKTDRKKCEKLRETWGERVTPSPFPPFFAALVLLSLLIRFLRSSTLTESLAHARFSFDRVYVDDRLNMLCANTGRQDSCERIFEKYTHDSLSGGRQM